MRKRAVVLLGGSGFIGTALARAFAGAGHPVRIVSRSKPARLPRGVAWVRGSIGDASAVARASRGAGCIFHLASDSVPGTVNTPAQEARANLMPSLAALGVLPERARVVFLSSGGAIYGEPARARARENDPVAPLSYYAAGKAALESFLGAYARQHRRDVVLLRPSNVYGPGQEAAPGFGLVPALFSAAAGGAPFRLFGDGATVRDFIYIDDLCALCLTLARARLGPGVRAYNAGSGRGHSVAQVLAAAERIAGARIARVRMPARRADVHRIVLDPGKARRELGWRPRVSLEEGLRRTWRWHASPR